MKKIKGQIYMIIVFVLIALGSLQFVSWICGMAFQNTCVELREQYIAVQVKDLINTIETSVNFGKDIKSYYGMEELLGKISNMSDSPLEAVLVDESGEVLYSTLKNNDESKAILAELYSDQYQEEIENIKEVKADSLDTVDTGKYRTMVFPLYQNGESFLGHMIVVYQTDSLVTAENYSDQAALFRIWAVVAVMLIAFYGITQRSQNDQWYIKFMPVILIMAGMLFYIVNMFTVYQDRYNVIITENATSSAALVQDSIDSLLEKGFDAERIEEVSDFINQKVAANDSIGNISIGRIYYNTSDTPEVHAEDSLLHMPIAGTDMQMEVSISQSYINSKIINMTLTFIVIFIICLMITYELTYFGEIISVRMSKDFNTDAPRQYESISSLIRLLSFVSYTAIYTSMPYAAVIMRKWDASVFGLSQSVSASLPLTVELSLIMLGSVMIQRLFKNEKVNRVGIMIFPFLILGNLACTTASSPYILIGLRAFCGIGFAFLKYWLNTLVAAGSEDAKGVGVNYAKLNGGLLGGITVGASLGAILAQALGYQSNYYFTVLMSMAVMAVMVLCVPFKFLESRRKPVQQSGETKKSGKESIFANPAVLKVLLLGCVPLNIGLMYVVAFLPVYMDNVGQSALATSYAYLINGLSGVYLGVVMVSMLKKMSQKGSVVFAMILGAIGILVLTLNESLVVIMVSAAVMGLFDGFGTPKITSYFTSMPEVQNQDTAGMLTIFNSVGSGVQILCPMLYNILIQPDGDTLYLLIFGICYAVVAVVFFLFMGDKKQWKPSRLKEG